jgi:hypothetical protein
MLAFAPCAATQSARPWDPPTVSPRGSQRLAAYAGTGGTSGPIVRQG